MINYLRQILVLWCQSYRIGFIQLLFTQGCCQTARLFILEESVFSRPVLSFWVFFFLHFLSWLQYTLQWTHFISDGWHLSAPSEVTGLDFLSSPLSLCLTTSFPNQHQQPPDHTICSALLLPARWQEIWRSLNPWSLSPRIHACWSCDDLLRADEPPCPFRSL